MSHGYPFDVAFGCDATWRAAASILFSEFESGKVYDWDLGAFPED